MARSKQALFPARFVHPLRRPSNSIPDPSSSQQPKDPSSAIQTAPGPNVDTHNTHVQSAHVRKSPARNTSVLAPIPTRISKHARKSAPNTSLEVSSDQVGRALRAVSNGSIYAPSENGEDDDENSLFVPMNEPRSGSPESLGDQKGSERMDVDRKISMASGSNADVRTDTPWVNQKSDTWRSEPPRGAAPTAQMTIRSTPASSILPRQPTVDTRASAAPTATNATARSVTSPIKADPTRRNPHSLPDLSAKLTSVITVTTRGPRNGESKIVTLHVAMLEDKSPFLTRLAESSPGPDLCLLELDCDAFSKFAAWVYGGGFEFDTFLSEDLGDILNSVLDCYTLALKLEATQFANAVLEKACKVSAERGLVFRNDVVNAMFARTNRGSKLRKWIVDEWVWQFDAEGVSEVSWANDRVLEKEIVFEMFHTAAKRLGRGRQKHRSPSEMTEEYRIPPGQDVVAVD